jgi:hypothetical protein
MALAALALSGLAGCASSIEEMRRRRELERLAAFIEEGRPVVLMGMVEQARMPLLGSRLFRFGAARPAWPPEPRSPFSTEPEPAPGAVAFTARDRRWIAMRAEPGRYRLAHGMIHITPSGGHFPDTGVPLRYDGQVIEVAPGIGIAYVGTLRVSCAEGRGRIAMDSECRIEPDLLMETDLARAVAAEHLARAGSFAALATLPALPAPERLRVTPPAGVTEIAAAPEGWRVAVDWTEFSGDAASREAFRTAGGLMDTAAAIGGSSELGAMVSLPIIAAAAVAGAVGLAQAGAEQVAQSRAAQDWGDCAARVAAALAPETVAARLRSALPPPPPATARRRRSEPEGAAPASWRLGVTRVVLRRCAGPETGYGVDVASQWTAWTPGATEPAYDATLVVPVAGGIDDTRQQARRPRPWETVLPASLPCRAFAAYCAAGSEAALTQDVVDGVLAARDAIATAR